MQWMRQQATLARLTTSGDLAPARSVLSDED
jgi:hypothetical protein